MAVVHVRLDDTTLGAVDKLCEDRNVTRSALVRIAIIEYLGMRSESRMIGETLTRMVDFLEKLDATTSTTRSQVRSMAEETHILATFCEAHLKSFLYRVPPPSEVEDAACRARAAADFEKLTRGVARKVADGRA
jgi:hypothetical protein